MPGCPELARCTASMESARRVLASSRRVVMQFFGILGGGGVSGVGRRVRKSRAFSTRRQGCSMSRYASMFQTARLNRERLAWAGSHYATTERVLRHAPGFGVPSSDPVHCSRPWAFGYDFRTAGLQIQRNRGQSDVVLFSDGLPQAYNGQERIASHSLHRPAPLRQRDGITSRDSNATRAHGDACPARRRAIGRPTQCWSPATSCRTIRAVTRTSAACSTLWACRSCVFPAITTSRRPCAAS